MEDKAPWYVIACRILMLLIICALTYIFLIMAANAIIGIADKLVDSNVRDIILEMAGKHPKATLIIVILGYIAWTVMLTITSLMRGG